MSKVLLLGIWEFEIGYEDGIEINEWSEGYLMINIFG